VGWGTRGEARGAEPGTPPGRLRCSRHELDRARARIFRLFAQLRCADNLCLRSPESRVRGPEPRFRPNVPGCPFPGSDPNGLFVAVRLERPRAGQGRRATRREAGAGARAVVAGAPGAVLVWAPREFGGGGNAPGGARATDGVADGRGSGTNVIRCDDERPRASPWQRASTSQVTTRVNVETDSRRVCRRLFATHSQRSRRGCRVHRSRISAVETMSALMCVGAHSERRSR
jgi:hypothetical protein